MCNVLLFDKTDFLIELSADIAGLHDGDNVHIVVHRLLLSRRDDGCMELCQRIGRLVIDEASHVVKRIAVLGDCRPARHDFRIMTYKIFRPDALLHFQQVCIAVKMVEVLKQCEIKGRLDHHIRLFSRHFSSKVNGKLFIRDSMLEDAFVHRLESGNHLLLLLFTAADEGKLAAQIVVVAYSVEAMTEPDRLKLSAVHQHDAGLCVWVDLILAVWLWENARPVSE